MKLDIPHYKQEKTLSCGLAALRMVFSYYGNKTFEKELTNDTKIHSFGILTTDLGIIALKLGYKVKIYTFHLPLLSPHKFAFGKEIKMEDLSKIKPDPKSKLTYESWEKYLESGGELIWEYPKIEIIKSLIENKIPCIVAVNTAALGNYWRSWDNGHFFVINGIDDKNVFVLDPAETKEKAAYEIDDELLLSSVSINARVSAGYLVAIEK